MSTLAQTRESCAAESVGSDPVICRCLNVTESEVQTAISAFNAQSVRELGHCTGAGKGCMACHGRIKALIAAQLG